MVVVGVDRFLELVYEIGEGVGEKPKAFFVGIEFGLNF